MGASRASAVDNCSDMLGVGSECAPDDCSTAITLPSLASLKQRHAPRAQRHAVGICPGGPRPPSTYRVLVQANGPLFCDALDVVGTLAPVRQQKRQESVQQIACHGGHDQIARRLGRGKGRWPSQAGAKVGRTGGGTPGRGAIAAPTPLWIGDRAI